MSEKSGLRSSNPPPVSITPAAPPQHQPHTITTGFPTECLISSTPGAVTGVRDVVPSSVPDEHEGPPERAALVGYRLPAPIQAAFLDVGSLKFPTFELGRNEKSKRLVAAWMAALGWTVDDVEEALTLREAGRRTKHGRPGFWEGVRRREAVESLTLGRYLVFGEVPEESPTARWTLSAIKYGTTPGGIPNLTAIDLDDYLTGVVAARSALGGIQSDRLVLAAMAEIAKKAGTIVPSPGVRRLMHAVGMGSEAVIAALARLEAHGFLAVLSKGKGGTTRYMVRAPWSVRTETTLISSDTEVSRSNTSCSAPDTIRVGHPAFHRDALGKKAFELLHCLVGSRPTTDDEWRAHAGVSRSTFYRLKPALLGLTSDNEWQSLVVETESGWELNDPTTVKQALNDVAKAYRTVQLHERRDVRIQKERDGYGAWRIRDLVGFRAINSHQAVDCNGRIWRIDDLIDELGNPKPIVESTSPNGMQVGSGESTEEAEQRSASEGTP